MTRRNEMQQENFVKMQHLPIFFSVLFTIALGSGAHAQSVGGRSDDINPATPSAYSNVPIIQRSERETIALVQAELNRLGCNLGAADGVVGARSRAALRAYLENTNTDYQYRENLFNDPTFLAIIKMGTETVCENMPDAPVVRDQSQDPSAIRSSLQGTYRAEIPCGIIHRRYGGGATVTIERVGANSVRFTHILDRGGQISGSLTRSNPYYQILRGPTESSGIRNPVTDMEYEISCFQDDCAQISISLRNGMHCPSGRATRVE